ncbi:MAG: hypothetical protein V1720_21195 [bacterium]
MFSRTNKNQLVNSTFKKLPSGIITLFEFIKSKNSSKNIRELLWYFGGQIIAVVLGFLTIKLLSFAGTTDYGIYALIFTISNFFGLTYIGPITQTFNRFFHNYEGKEGFRDFFTIIINLILAGVVVVLIISAVFAIFPWIDNFSPGIILLSGLFVITSKMSEFCNSLLNITRKRAINSIIINLERIMIIIMLYFLYQSRHFKLIYIFLIFNIAYFIFSSIRIYYFQKLIKENFKQPVRTSGREYQKLKSGLLSYLMPFIVWGVAGWMQLNGEKWIIAYKLTTSDVGIYAVMISIVNAFLSIPSTYLSEFFTPIIYKCFSDLNNIQSVKTGKFYIRFNIILILLLTLFVSLFTYFFGSLLTELISTASFLQYSYLLPIFSLAIGLFNIGQSMTFYGLALNKPKIYIAPKILTGFLSVLFNILLISFLGFEGVAYSALLIGIVYILTTMYANSKLNLITT